MLVRAVVEEHAEEAACLWSLRSDAVGHPHYDLPSLGHLDERVEAHLDGLRLAGDVALQVCKAGLDEEEPGSAFAATAVAVERRDLRAIAEILDVAGSAPELRRAMVSALGWLPFAPVSHVLPGLLDPSCPPALHLLGIAGCAVQRRDPGAALANALYSEDAPLRARAARAVGELGRADLMRPLGACLGDADGACAFFAAWSMALLGAAEAVPALWARAEGGGRVGMRACAVAVRRAEPAIALDHLRALGGRRESYRVALAGAGMLGDPQLVPWLLQCMELPDLARVAGEAFTLITGADFEKDRLRGKAPAGFKAGPSEDPASGETALDPDENLPWPVLDAVKRWWGANRAGLRDRTRYLLGKPIAAPWLEHVLRTGSQRHRAAAALELSIGAPGRPLFAVAAPAFRQQRVLA